MGNKTNEAPAKHLNWSIPMDKEFLQVMIREQENGNRPDSVFTPQAYTNMVEEQSKIFGKDITNDHLKNRLKTLKEHFSKFHDVFQGVSMTGFSWDPTTKLLGAEDEVWDTLIKDKPEAAKWRRKPIHHYHEMIELFGKDRATGAGAETAKDRNKRLQQNAPRVETIEEIDQLLETNDITLENFTCADDIYDTSPTPQSHVKIPSSSSSKKRKIEKDDEFTSGIISSIKDVAEAINRSTKVMESSRPRVYSEEEIFKELELLGMSSEDLPKAYLFLVKHPEEARALFGCPLHMRMTILSTTMGSSE